MNKNFTLVSLAALGLTASVSLGQVNRNPSAAQQTPAAAVQNPAAQTQAQTAAQQRLQQQTAAGAANSGALQTQQNPAAGAPTRAVQPGALHQGGVRVQQGAGSQEIALATPQELQRAIPLGTGSTVVRHPTTGELLLLRGGANDSQNRGAVTDTVADNIPMRLSPAQRQYINATARDLGALSHSQNTLAVRQRLSNQLFQAAQTEGIQLPQQEVAQLIGDVATVWGNLNLSPQHRVLLARNMNLLMASPQITPAQAQLIVGHTQSLFQAGGLPATQAQQLAGSFNTISDQRRQSGQLSRSRNLNLTPGQADGAGDGAANQLPDPSQTTLPDPGQVELPNSAPRE